MYLCTYLYRICVRPKTGVYRLDVSKSVFDLVCGTVHHHHNHATSSLSLPPFRTAFLSLFYSHGCLVYPILFSLASQIYAKHTHIPRRLLYSLPSSIFHHQIAPTPTPTPRASQADIGRPIIVAPQRNCT